MGFLNQYFEDVVRKSRFQSFICSRLQPERNQDLSLANPLVIACFFSSSVGPWVIPALVAHFFQRRLVDCHEVQWRWENRENHHSQKLILVLLFGLWVASLLHSLVFCWFLSVGLENSKVSQKYKQILWLVTTCGSLTIEHVGYHNNILY